LKTNCQHETTRQRAGQGQKRKMQKKKGGYVLQFLMGLNVCVENTSARSRGAHSLEKKELLDVTIKKSLFSEDIAAQEKTSRYKKNRRDSSSGVGEGKGHGQHEGLHSSNHRPETKERRPGKRKKTSPLTAASTTVTRTQKDSRKHLGERILTHLRPNATQASRTSPVRH